MKKSTVLSVFLLVFTLFQMSCGPHTNTSPAKGNTEEDIIGNLLKDDKSKWIPPHGIDTNYAHLKEINPGKVPEIRLGFDIDPFNFIVRETADGFICSSNADFTESANSENTRTMPKVRKLDKEGSILWEREYDYKTYSGRLNNLLVYPDGSFVFTVQTYPYYTGEEQAFEKSFIIKCDRDGNEKWKREFDDYCGGLLQNLFLTEKGDIVAVGQWRIMDGIQVKEGADDIVVTKLDRDGNLILQKGFGGSDFDNVNTACYNRSLGIVINGSTQSADGDFAINGVWTRDDFVACIDEGLNLRWVYPAGGKEDFIYNLLAVSDDFVYVPGLNREQGSTSVVGSLIKIDRDGKRVWIKQDICAGLWGSAIAIFQNGDIVIGSGQQNKGMIVVLDRDGREKKRLEDLKFAPNSITPTDDGGFIVTANRQIKAVPQPPQISCIWYDTEITAVKYGSDYKMEWRKSYDKYKDDKGYDFVFPLGNGSIIVE